jgi:rhamnopyranosyl-N-acetylglucosaminyl-diphospho-decaprenol beta-1,3/1,4-galactofuranosyltransferase
LVFLYEFRCNTAALRAFLARSKNRAAPPARELEEPLVSPILANLGGPARRVTAVVVTRDRPALLRRCLEALLEQSPRACDAVIVVDNASGPETRAVLNTFPAVRVLRQPRNLGGAGGYCIGMMAALRDGADWIWAMDDDGRPRDPDCLHALLALAKAEGALLAAPLVLDVDQPERVAFPLRIAGRTRFSRAEVQPHGVLRGFAHLFNGALIAAPLLFAIGLPDPRFVMRGDEVEFLLRARRAGAGIVLATDAAFLHPGSAAEIHPILGGAFYATLPVEESKRFLQFRNRAWIFRRYGMWTWLLADIVRYGCFWIGSRRDPRGFADWTVATWTGLRGDFMRDTKPSAAPEPHALLAQTRR